MTRVLTLVGMKKRADFLRAKEGRRFGLPGLALEACPSPNGIGAAGALRVGFTATRHIGGAVERNRAKRRLRALARQVLGTCGREGHDYVLIARPGTLSRRFAELELDLNLAITAVHAALDKKKRNESHGRITG